MKNMHGTEDGAHIIPLILPESLEPQRDNLENALLSAQRRLKAFAEEYGWGDLVRESFADGAKIFDSKEKFDQAVIAALEMDDAIKLPETFCACLENRIFMAVSPELYARLYAKGIEAKSYEKLIAHEMAHRLHVRILSGDEDAMGPIWFFEGFAIFAADQFADSELELSRNEILEIVKSGKRGCYEAYSVVFRHFLRKAPLQDLVKEAGADDFADRLKRLPETRTHPE